ncbi:hypothetical protein FHR87_003913 [Azomonas macrocytogenes]|uniref:Uncharacterized protein n=1 Tax=Azomonas macrocytogenes TaxID=69962 RepID=A0A839T999_AZOMA|nr:hypothetical protein [Azomonas macrocytogenes]
MTLDELEAESTAFVRSVQQLIEHELRICALDAMKASDAFWQYNIAMRDEAEDQGRVGTRTRIKNNSIQCEWYINTFFNDRNAPADAKKRVLSTYLEKGAGFRYPKSRFQKARHWELNVIERVEDRYELVRMRSQALAKLRRALAEYERLVERSYNA